MWEETAENKEMTMVDTKMVGDNLHDRNFESEGSFLG
jgi:hypothetical protein